MTLRESERKALACATRVVTTSDWIAHFLAGHYAVPVDKMVVVRPGTDPAPMSQGSSDAVVQLLSVGAIVPRKGFDVLIAALAILSDLPWRLSIAGDCRDLQTVAKLHEDIERFRLRDRVKVLGAVSPKCLAELYCSADAFVLASRLEGYGMAYAEALAHGLPVIGTTAGAIPYTVPANTSMLVAPDDANALALGLRRVIADVDFRHELAESARRAAGQLPAWRDSAALFANVLECVA
jgi:glycosyltransferase involved in cell wall biosynthesis